LTARRTRRFASSISEISFLHISRVLTQTVILLEVDLKFRGCGKEDTMFKIKDSVAVITGGGTIDKILIQCHMIKIHSIYCDINYGCPRTLILPNRKHPLEKGIIILIPGNASATQSTFRFS